MVCRGVKGAIHLWSLNTQSQTELIQNRRFHVNHIYQIVELTGETWNCLVREGKYCSVNFSKESSNNHNGYIICKSRKHVISCVLTSMFRYSYHIHIWINIHNYLIWKGTEGEIYSWPVTVTLKKVRVHQPVSFSNRRCRLTLCTSTTPN